MTDGKTLYLVRHADADWTNSNPFDFDRNLSKHGKCEAMTMGQHLQQSGISPDLVICSMARRAIQTLEHLAPPMEIPIADALLRKSMYEAPASTLLQIIQELDDPFKSAMLIGHNPSMSQLAARLTGERIHNMPTCAMATVSLPVNHWKDAGMAIGQLLNFDVP